MSADKLTLPPKAFIAFRQSGGLRFSTREVTVYLDGRVTWQRAGKIDAAQGEHQLTPDEVADLQTAIEQSGLFELPTISGRPSPDGYAHELSVRLAQQSASIEFFDGSIPPRLQTLLKQLKRLFSEENRPSRA